MRVSLLLIPVVGLLASPAVGQLTYPFASATGYASAAALVPGGTPASVDESYEFSHEESVMHRHEYRPASESAEGNARARLLSQLTLNRRADHLDFFLSAGTGAGGTHPQAMAESCSEGELGLDFEVSAAGAGAWSLWYDVRTGGANPGLSMSASLLFERVGGAPLIDALVTEPNQAVGQIDLTIHLSPGRYRVRADVGAMSAVSGAFPDDMYASGGVFLLLYPVPGTSVAGALLAGAAWGTVRRRR